MRSAPATRVVFPRLGSLIPSEVGSPARDPRPTVVGRTPRCRPCCGRFQRIVPKRGCCRPRCGTLSRASPVRGGLDDNCVLFFNKSELQMFSPRPPGASTGGAGASQRGRQQPLLAGIVRRGPQRGRHPGVLPTTAVRGSRSRKPRSPATPSRRARPPQSG